MNNAENPHDNNEHLNYKFTVDEISKFLSKLKDNKSFCRSYSK